MTVAAKVRKTEEQRERMRKREKDKERLDESDREQQEIEVNELWRTRELVKDLRRNIH